MLEQLAVPKELSTFGTQKEMEMLYTKCERLSLNFPDTDKYLFSL